MFRIPYPKGFTWPRGVTVSTLDSESSDRGSNPREAFIRTCAYVHLHPTRVNVYLPRGEMDQTSVYDIGC